MLLSESVFVNQNQVQYGISYTDTIRVLHRSASFCIVLDRSESFWSKSLPVRLYFIVYSSERLSSYILFCCSTVCTGTVYWYFKFSTTSWE